MSKILYIAAKAPRPMLAKTRLGRAIGHERAIQLYTAFLQDIGARFARSSFPVGWYITPPDAWAELAPHLGDKPIWANVLAQPQGDWTERQRSLFRTATERREEQVLLIASDSPQLTIRMIEQAFDALEQHDLVLGPVSDGGYYLIGMRGWHDVLADIPMSTSSVVGDITFRARSMGLSVAHVEAAFDIDTVEDLLDHHALLMKRNDLPATKRALANLSLARSPEQVDRGLQTTLERMSS